MKTEEEIVKEMRIRTGKNIHFSPVHWDEYNNRAVRYILVDGQIKNDQALVDLAYEIANGE
jgi:hypothetical protein